MSGYPPPVDQLLGLGATGDRAPTAWLDYRSLGLSREHIPDLIRMVQDRELLESREDVAVYAPGHAARALAQLQAVEAADALLDVLEYERSRNRDWTIGEFEELLGSFDPAILPKLIAFLQDASHQYIARGVVAGAMGLIAARFPERRSEVVETFGAHLRVPGGDAGLNGFILAALLDLGAAEALPDIEAAFVGQRIDPVIAGDWDYVQWYLGGQEGPEPRGLSSLDRLQKRMADREANDTPSLLTPRERAQARRKAKKALKRSRSKGK